MLLKLSRLYRNTSVTAITSIVKYVIQGKVAAKTNKYGNSPVVTTVPPCQGHKLYILGLTLTGN